MGDRDHSLSYRGELLFALGGNRRAIVRAEESVAQGAVIERRTIAPLTGAHWKHLALESLDEACGGGDGRVGRTAERFAVGCHRQFGEFGNAGRLCNRRFGVQPTDGPRGQRYGAGRRAISPASRCAIVGRHLSFRKASEVGDRRIKQGGDLRESACQVRGATLGRAEAASDQREEPTTNDRNGVERIPRLGLHLV